MGHQTVKRQLTVKQSKDNLQSKDNQTVKRQLTDSEKYSKINSGCKFNITRISHVPTD